jgi:hypothetical protein
MLLAPVFWTGRVWALPFLIPAAALVRTSSHSEPRQRPERQE